MNEVEWEIVAKSVVMRCQALERALTESHEEITELKEMCETLYSKGQELGEAALSPEPLPAMSATMLRIEALDAVRVWLSAMPASTSPQAMAPWLSAGDKIKQMLHGRAYAMRPCWDCDGVGISKEDPDGTLDCGSCQGLGRVEIGSEKT